MPILKLVSLPAKKKYESFQLLPGFARGGLLWHVLTPDDAMKSFLGIATFPVTDVATCHSREILCPQVDNCIRRECRGSALSAGLFMISPPKNQ